MPDAELFDWDEANIAHVAEHGVTPSEAEEVVANHPLDLDYSFRNGEMRLRQVGETSAGRVLAVITMIRNRRIRVITAYPASRSLRVTYLKHKEAANDGKENSS
jgi:uncharacterized DUF497 family protein